MPGRGACGQMDREVLQRIDKKKEQLDSLRPLSVGEVERLRQEFLVEFAYNSNAIEGSTLTLRETAMILEGITIDRKPLREHLEVVGQKDAFAYVLELVENETPLSERVIREIHSLVLIDKPPQDRGVYRRVPVRILGSRHTPPQPYLVPIQMEELMGKYENWRTVLHVVERVAAFHLSFEVIHPFIDGNGRTGRLLMNLELLQAGFPAINVKFADRERYYGCFGSYFETGSTVEMVKLVAEYVEEMVDRYLDILQQY
ncbi:MAG: Fic family protein [Firmicutes bacterium]|nr:Fic family protein [Bacillota bacterium]